MIKNVFTFLIGVLFLLTTAGEKTCTDIWTMDNNINGISISPKKNFCIIKIWLKNKDIFNNENVKEYFNIPDEYTGDLIFKNHIV